MRRIEFIRVAQRAGCIMSENPRCACKLPNDRAPSREDWQRWLAVANGNDERIIG